MHRLLSVRSSRRLVRDTLSFSSPLRSFAAVSGAKSNTKEADRARADYGPPNPSSSVGLPQEGQANSRASGVSSQSFPGNPAQPSPTTSSSPPQGSSQRAKGAEAKRGEDSTVKPTPTPLQAQHRKASGKSSTEGNSASDVHRRQEDYTKRDEGTAAEQGVAADRAAHDPLPDQDKHSTKSKSPK